jgi:hypothetical protein
LPAWYAGAGDFKMRHLFLVILLLFPVEALVNTVTLPRSPRAVTLETGLGDINHSSINQQSRSQKFL